MASSWPKVVGWPNFTRNIKRLADFAAPVSYVIQGQKAQSRLPHLHRKSPVVPEAHLRNEVYFIAVPECCLNSLV
jgi:hypothetical protein